MDAQITVVYIVCGAVIDSKRGRQDAAPAFFVLLYALKKKMQKI
jgi:hypothetical protein